MLCFSNNNGARSSQVRTNGFESGGGHFPAGFFASSGPAVPESTQRGREKEIMKTCRWFNRTRFFSIVRIGTAGTLISAAAVMAVPAAKADPTAYLAVNLVSDQPGVAPIVDPSLVNAWGIALGSSSPFWVSSEGIGVSTLYAGDVTTPLSSFP